MPRFFHHRLIGAMLLVMFGTSGPGVSPLMADPPPMEADGKLRSDFKAAQTIRIATYNVSLYDKTAGKVLERLQTGTDRQAQQIAAVIQTVSPDILLLCEIDFDEQLETLDALNDLYLKVPQNAANLKTSLGTHLGYEYRYAVASNTGLDSGIDLNGNNKLGEPSDAWGFGHYPGQYAMAVLSRFPIDTNSIRTFQKLRWSNFPGANQPVAPRTGRPYYEPSVWSQLRLSSKNHVDVPIKVGERVIHLLACHPTPPVFDGPEDRNGCRNHDEIAFWSVYLDGDASRSLVDDAGNRGGLADEALFVIAGDMNSDPQRGNSRREAISSLLQNPRLTDPAPTWMGTKDPSQNQTASFGNGRLMRIDYVLPSKEFQLRRAEVFWPSEDHPQRKLLRASDHRLVWIEVSVP